MTCMKLIILNDWFHLNTSKYISSIMWTLFLNMAQIVHAFTNFLFQHSFTHIKHPQELLISLAILWHRGFSDNVPNTTVNTKRPQLVRASDRSDPQLSDWLQRASNPAGTSSGRTTQNSSCRKDTSLPSQGKKPNHRPPHQCIVS